MRGFPSFSPKLSGFLRKITVITSIGKRAKYINELSHSFWIVWYLSRVKKRVAEIMTVASFAFLFKKFQIALSSFFIKGIIELS